MNTKRLNERDRATLDRIMRPAQQIAETAQTAVHEFLHSHTCRQYIERVVREELKRLSEEDESCL